MDEDHFALVWMEGGYAAVRFGRPPPPGGGAGRGEGAGPALIKDAYLARATVNHFNAFAIERRPCGITPGVMDDPLTVGGPDARVREDAPARPARELMFRAEAFRNGSVLVHASDGPESGRAGRGGQFQIAGEGNWPILPLAGRIKFAAPARTPS